MVTKEEFERIKEEAFEKVVSDLMPGINNEQKIALKTLFENPLK